MKNKLEVLGQHVSKYLEDIQKLVIDKIKSQNNDIFSVRGVDYEVRKIERYDIETLDIDEGGLHHLFSQNGCNLSGTILIRAQTYLPRSDRNVSSSNNFEIVFKNTPIKFNFEDETFALLGDINIAYINLTDKRF